jgi:hypothetical protein
MPGPTGHRLDDGFASYWTFSADTTIGLWEKEVTPPGWDGGDAIDTTTMRNTNLRTFYPRKLKTQTPSSFRAAYDEGHLVRIEAMINVPQQITIFFPTGRPYTFWAYLRSFQPDQLREGDQPTATCVVQPMNQNLAGVETEPTLGTTTSTTTTTTP